MSEAISLRKVPPQALRLAHQLCEQTGLSMADILRQAIVSGLLVEATRVAPDEEGRLAGLEAASLARALRRHLSSAIDLLVEYGEHPSQGVLRSEEHPSQGVLRSEEGKQHWKPPMQSFSSQHASEAEAFSRDDIGDDLEMLGIGMSFAETAGVKPSS